MDVRTLTPRSGPGSSRGGVKALMLAGALAYCAVPATPSLAMSPSVAPRIFPGLLVFVNRPFDGTPSTIWTVVPGSSKATEIAHANVPLIAPAFSPSGDEIAFDRDVDYRYNDARDKLVIANADGSAKRVSAISLLGRLPLVRRARLGTRRPNDLDVSMRSGQCPKSSYHSFYAVW